MTGALGSLHREYSLTDDELQAVAGRVGVQSFPTVLAVRPRHSTIDRLDTALDEATRALAIREVIVDGVVDQDLVAVLHALQRPDRELAMRLMTPDGLARVCVARRAAMCVMARRIGHDFVLRVLDHGSELGVVAAALVAELPRSAVADITPVGAPLATMAEALSGTHDPAVLADRVRAFGTDTRAAMLLGTALAARQAFAEIVYHELASEDGRISRGPGAVGVFYTKRGRIVAAPSVSPVGQLWTTLKAGSDHALAQAIGRLVELSGEGWGDP
jgi:hypothetical protein